MTKLVAITVAALLFRRHDTRTGGESLKVITTRQDVLDHPYDNPGFDFNFITHALGLSSNHFVPDDGYLPAYITLMRKIEIAKGVTHSVSDYPGPPDDNIYRAMINEEDHELEWHHDEDNRDDSYFKADTENVHVLAGAIDPDHVEAHYFTRGILNGGSISVDPPLEDSALIAMILVETTPESSTYLIIATGKLKNEGQLLDQVFPVPPPPDPPLWTVNQWGSNRVLVEGISAHITLPVSANNVDCFILNPDGSEYIGFEPEPSGNHCIVHLSPGNQTLWYKVVISS